MQHQQERTLPVVLLPQPAEEDAAALLIGERLRRVEAEAVVEGERRLAEELDAAGARSAVTSSLRLKIL